MSSSPHRIGHGRRLLAALLFILTARGTHAQSPSPHFVDEHGTPLPSLETIHPQLVRYFGAAVPNRITVRPGRFESTSQFHPPTQSVLIGAAHRGPAHFHRVVAHESCHLALAAYTRGASTLEAFRFFDEGFAKIFDAEVSGQRDGWRREALSIAWRQLQAGNVSFDKVQAWQRYFGNPTAAGGQPGNPWAYPVGSSFDYFLIDSVGMDGLFAFFRAIGEERDLDRALRVALGRDRAEVERAWLAWLAAFTPSTAVPRIVRRLPADDATVPASLAEIEVEFDQPMSSQISLGTRCDGVCYRDAYWKNDTTLAVRVSLQPGRTYALNLGSGQGRLRSADGAVDLPLTAWRFHTAPPEQAAPSP